MSANAVSMTPKYVFGLGSALDPTGGNHTTAAHSAGPSRWEESR